MGAAESNFPPPETQYPSWLAMAQSVFNQQASRWDDANCGGGMRWQIFPTNTEDQKWLTPLNGLLNHTLQEFFPASMGDKIMVEVACEPFGTCDTDNWTFKSYVIRWLALTAQLVPTTAATIWPYIQASSKGAAGQCDGGTDGMTCGFRWNSTIWDGTYGVGQQMSALSAIQSNLITVDNVRAPYTADTGGTSPGDPSAGSGTGDVTRGEAGVYTRTIGAGDKAGAGILTALVLIMTLGGAWLESLRADEDTDMNDGNESPPCSDHRQFVASMNAPYTEGSGDPCLLHSSIPTAGPSVRQATVPVQVRAAQDAIEQMDAYDRHAKQTKDYYVKALQRQQASRSDAEPVQPGSAQLDPRRRPIG
ncbi:hypothetical protein B0A55_01126 [Friedmanniomyces simplex]|uniref:mannan endo-1,6-alpha-mannosidase n=1 Tax=Friedmanniomyces simplex TaxID=329884 RepID=A0A4U0XV69_9PEZI|nr:hypothetical protein B0A55_01126 [Friedmanniomyces simplex]